MNRSYVLVVAILLALTPPVAASESCKMLGGTCRDRCGVSEQTERGDFEDCGATQECCVASRTPEPVRCCIHSFSAKDFGPANCVAPQNDGCLTGSASPVPCAQLPMCR